MITPSRIRLTKPLTNPTIAMDFVSCESSPRRIAFNSILPRITATMASGTPSPHKRRSGTDNNPKIMEVVARDLLTVCGNGGGYPGVNWSGGGTIYGLRLAWGGGCGGCGREVGSKAPHLKQSRFVGACCVPHLGQKFVIRITRNRASVHAERKKITS